MFASMAIKTNRRPIKLPKLLKYGSIILLLIIAIGGYKAKQYYDYIFAPSVNLSKVEEPYLYIPTGATFDDVTNLIEMYDLVKKPKGFLWVAEKKSYPTLVKPGRYKLTEGMSNSAFIDLLRSGNQRAVDLTFNNVRTPAELAGKLASQLESDSLDFLSLFQDKSQLEKYKTAPHRVISLFIPNTYKVYWNTSPQKLLSRMKGEFDRFWNDTRLAKLKEVKLNREEVITLASIVDEETIVSKEKPRVAGLYINRLHRGILLQADPTLRFALNDFNIKRVLNEHKLIESPYNTYKYKGLPPGPIRMPSIEAIDAVLNYERHKFLYMCAKEDFSGEHNFAKTLRQHNKNAKLYHNALNKRRIYK